MADTGQKTEKPTKRRVEKARKEGRFPISREMVASVHFLAFVWVLMAWSERFLGNTLGLTRTLFMSAFHTQIGPRTVTRLYYQMLSTALVPLLLTGAVLLFAFLAIQLTSTKLGIATKKLAPDITRLNPASRLRSLPQQNFSSLIQALLLIPVLCGTVYAVGRANMDTLLQLPGYAVRPAISTTARSIGQLLWRSAWVLVCIGSVDMLRQYKRHSESLRMTKQEIREEMKETDGNPQIKSRVRRIQRDLARRTMMAEVPKATAVIVNPTHYAVALKYDIESMAAPRVIAKGKNYLALRIRQLAADHAVPIIENQPLAQALYKSADVGQEIPAHLYRAVAEILAYIYKLVQRRRH